MGLEVIEMSAKSLAPLKEVSNTPIRLSSPITSYLSSLANDSADFGSREWQMSFCLRECSDLSPSSIQNHPILMRPWLVPSVNEEDDAVTETTLASTLSAQSTSRNERRTSAADT
eukprot:CAMPEP_0194290080 /NCGR_PEP_ID=MMETSP0169-20130528/40520_1 /TAXON_ID=218684 /ORGANISM="Corethron pennatum, Strain L29A3" /LENGTH=114 /DNA_ID=CAMNT_0039037583 /DNA_START=95 /DNA_END=439 /DNA_ORIENTATION=-